MEQRINTQQGISQENQQAGELGQKQAATGIALAASVPLAELGGGMVGGGPLKRSFGSGALGAGSYDAIKAAGEGKSATEIMDSLTHGMTFGGILGPVIHGIGGAITGPIKAKAAQQTELALAKTLHARQTGILEFARSFQPQWLSTRFKDLAVVADPSTPAADIANTLLQKLMGQEAAGVATPEALDILTRKIDAYRNLSGRDPALREAMAFGPQPTPPVPGLQGVGAPLEGAPGMAPEPQPAALGGPMGDQQQFTPPAVPQTPDLEGATTGAAPPAPITPEPATIPPATPEMGFPPGVGGMQEPGVGSLSKPLGVFSGSPVEPATVNLPPVGAERTFPYEPNLSPLKTPTGIPGPMEEINPRMEPTPEPTPEAAPKAAKPEPAKKTKKEPQIKVGSQLPDKKLPAEDIKARKLTIARDLRDMPEGLFKRRWFYTKDEIRKILEAA
jgi:hypothetical protein